MGGARRPRPRVLLPHRHRTARRQPHPRRVLPRAGRCAPELRRDHLRRPAGGVQGDQASGVFDQYPALPGDRLRRRGDVGAVPRRPPRRGVSTARDGSAARARTPPERVPLRARVRVVPTRPVSAGRRCGRWAGRTGAGAATTRTSRARSVTTQGTLHACSTTSTRRTRPHRRTRWQAFLGALPARPVGPPAPPTAN